MLKWCGTDPSPGDNSLSGCKDGNNGNTRTKGRILLCLIDFGRAKDTRLEAYSELLNPCKKDSTTDTDSEVGMEEKRGRGRGTRTGTGGRTIPHDRGRDRDRGENGDGDRARGKSGDRDGVKRGVRNCYGKNEVEETKEEDEGEGEGGGRGVVVSYTKSCAKNAFSYDVTVEHERGMYVRTLRARTVLTFTICYNLELIHCNFSLLYVILLCIIMLYTFWLYFVLYHFSKIQL